MAVEGATGKAAVTGALICLGVVGVAAAASPGRLSVGDPAWWLVAGLALAALAVLVVAAAVLLLRHPKAARAPKAARERQRVPPSILLVFVVVAAMAWALSELSGGRGVYKPPPSPRGVPPTPKPNLPQSGGGGGNAGPWLAIALGALILAALVAIAVHQRRARPPVATVEVVPGDPLAAAVEAALLDLEGETDPRRAVIKAYARAEAVLREHGLPRRPSEAPLEYLDRVLRDLGARAGAVDRLTELFERAAFSQHPVGPEMRDEAVAVFLGLRDELSADVGEP